MVVVGKHVPIFSCCGLVVEINHLTENIYIYIYIYLFLLPFQRQPSCCLVVSGPQMWLGHGSKSNRTPSEHPNPTIKIGSKMGGEFTYPKMVPLVLTHSHVTKTGLAPFPFFAQGRWAEESLKPENRLLDIIQ